MPLDAAGYVIEGDTAVLDPLAKLGITPVPADFVKHYKKEYARNWLRENYSPAPGWCEWRTLDCKRPGDVSYWLRHGIQSMISSDVSPAPVALVDLADLVVRNVPGARFSLDYFYRDPVLNVLYPVGDAWRTACLGIWDNGKMVRISDYPPRKWPRLPSVEIVGRALTLLGCAGAFLALLVSIFIL